MTFGFCCDDVCFDTLLSSITACFGSVRVQGYVCVRVNPGWVGRDGSVYSEHERLTPEQPIKEENAQEKGNGSEFP